LANFTIALLKRFHDEEEDDVYTKFARSKQKGNVNDYTHEWEVQTTRKTGLSDEQLLKVYIGGLKDYIRSEIKLWRPKTIGDARQATKLIEKNKVNKYTLPHMRDDDKHRRQDIDKKWVHKCRYCGDKRHMGTNATVQNYTSMVLKENQTPSSPTPMKREKGRKITVIDVVKIGLWVIDVHPITHIIVKL
jgi:hypothetical protein